MMKLYPWTQETFPTLSDAEHDILCAAQDAAGPLTSDDLYISADLPLIQRDQASRAVRRLCQESLLTKVGHRTGAIAYEITPLGHQYLNEPAPEGVLI